MCKHDASLTVATEPVGRAQPHNRRSFLTLLMGGCLAVVSLPARWAQAKKYGIKRDSIKALNTVGGSAQVKIKDKDVLLIRDSETSIRALNPICTHKKCLVKYQSATNDIGCKCHKSKFLLDGTVVSGPAPRPLGVYQTSLTADQIVISIAD